VDECKPLITGGMGDAKKGKKTSRTTKTVVHLPPMPGGGLHSSTFQLNPSRVGHTSPCPPV